MTTFMAMIGAFALLAPASGGAATQAEAPQTCVAAPALSAHCETRPRRLQVDEGGRLQGLSWVRFGGSDAVGYGSLRSLGLAGDPNQAGMATKAKARFFAPVSCGGKRWYSRLRVTYGGGYGKIYVPNQLWFECPETDGA